MKGDRIELGRTEQRRLLVLNQLQAGGLVNAEAAGLLGLSVRQVQRLHAAYVERGAAALVHGNRGRPSAHALDPALAGRVVELAKRKYAGFNQHHLTEMLAEAEGVQLSRPTIHRILKAAGIAAPRRRRPPRHRQRRDRYPREGMLLQVDASWHDWLEGRGPWLSLVGGIDDATGRVPWAGFHEREDAFGYFQLLREVVHRYGIPLSLYSDRHSIFIQTENRELSLEEQLAGRRHPTQFGRLLQELGVQLILARSPQAKGRVERLWGTFQDRLSSELRLADARTREQADHVLARYLPAQPSLHDPRAGSRPRLDCLARRPASRRRLLLQVPARGRQRQHRPLRRHLDRHSAQSLPSHLCPGPGGSPGPFRWHPARLSRGALHWPPAAGATGCLSHPSSFARPGRAASGYAVSAAPTAADPAVATTSQSSVENARSTRQVTKSLNRSGDRITDLRHPAGRQGSALT